ncbi:DUF4397 domain-containing protein [uncultured Mucilaginibacter sp.]|uniref:DUF4397 domain-containing protein n=1 Tax=uncultured Mucilaginibacter sp. TaxID=797541 RepID=UPI0025D16FC7|nr:DUF4397 domain-containing protein [uncultured Mucilaginibacter sp.]
MKRLLKNSKKMKWGIGALGLFSLLLSSCLKDTSNYVAPPTALVTFYQASPDEPAMNLALNTNQVNQNPLYYGDDIDYFRAYAGQRTVNLFFTNSLNTITTATVTLVANNAYSLFLANTSAHPEIVLLNDTLNRPASGNASIRLVNLSPDASAVDLKVQGGQVLVSNKAFKGYSSFLPISGQTNYTFQIMQTGTNTVLATLPNVPISNGFVYTILFHGLANTTNNGDKLAADLITNAYFY